MFVGHLAVALAAKRSAPRASLGWLMAGVTALDLLWPLFLLAGLEHVRIVPGATAFNSFVFDSYPWSHSLVMSVIWGLVLFALARWRGVAASAFLLVALVVSHWVLDYVTHLPDLPLWPGASPRFGLGLWKSITATFVVEGALWVGGIVLYLRSRPQMGGRARTAFWSLILVTTLMWIASPWSPPPPSAQAVAWFGLIGWIVLPWAAVADRPRG
jgi:membrane-bound metal-dependent hydrolase YbcI (DUF457 family)